MNLGLLTWALAVLPLILLSQAPGLGALAGASPLGLVLLPAAALAGLPRGTGAGAGRSTAVRSVALLLPPLALAARLELDMGRDAGSVLSLGGLGLLLVLLLFAGAERAGGRGWHALFWIALVPGVPLWVAALDWGAAPGAQAPRALAWLAQQSPLAWVHSWTRAGVEPGLAGAGGPCAVALVLLLASGWMKRGEGGS